MEYLALLLPVCMCWPARHLLAVTTAAALIIAAAGSRGGTASLVYLIPVLAVTFALSYRLGNAGGWRTITGPALLVYSGLCAMALRIGLSVFALPYIAVGAEVIGAVGVSGAEPSEKDEACAMDGIKAVQSMLK